MKKIAALLPLLLVGCVTNVGTRTGEINCDTDAGVCDVDAGKPFYRNLGVVARIGDSTQEGDLLSGSGFIQSGGYRAEFYRLSQAYGVAYSTTGTLSTGPGDPVLPARWALHDGHSGLETRQMLQPTGMPTWVQQWPQTPTLVFIQGGINDINHAYHTGTCSGPPPACLSAANLVVTDTGYEIEYLADRLIAMAQLAKEACHFQCRVIVETITPVLNKSAAMDYWNPIIRDEVANTPGLELADLAAVVGIDKISADGIHPSVAGYTAGGIEEARVAFGSLPN